MIFLIGILAFAAGLILWITYSEARYQRKMQERRGVDRFIKGDE